jgi:hypothetical protein
MLEKNVRKLYKQVSPNIVLSGILNRINDEETKLDLIIMTEGKIIKKTRSFGGHSNLAIPWAVNTALDFVRKQLCNEGMDCNEAS